MSYRFSVIQGILLCYRVKREKNAYSLTVSEYRRLRKKSITIKCIAQTRKEAEKVARFFCQNTVMSAHAADIFEELLKHPVISP